MLMTHACKLLLLVAAGVLLASCDKPPKGDQAIITDQVLAEPGTGDTFIVDTANSSIRFIGHGVGKNHPGTFGLTYGKVTATGDKVTGGTFIMDITSLDLEQEGEMMDEKLRPHLLSGDFFDAANFGTAKFEITAVKPYEPKDDSKSLVEGANFEVSGNLEIKRVTKNITFPARVELEGDRLEAEADFDIDRRQWEMNYGNDRTLGDQFIHETVNIELRLQALRKGQALEM